MLHNLAYWGSVATASILAETIITGPDWSQLPLQGVLVAAFGVMLYFVIGTLNKKLDTVAEKLDEMHLVNANLTKVIEKLDALIRVTPFK